MGSHLESCPFNMAFGKKYELGIAAGISLFTILVTETNEAIALRTSALATLGSFRLNS